MTIGKGEREKKQRVKRKKKVSQLTRCKHNHINAAPKSDHSQPRTIKGKDKQI